MKKYFEIKIEFDKTKVVKTINDAIINQKKGYVCVIDGNVLANSYKDGHFKSIINSSMVNICDGSSIALLTGLIHKKKYFTFTGPEIFGQYIKKDCKQYFLGNTDENLNKLQRKFKQLGYNDLNYKFKSLPYMDVLNFDYKTINHEITLFSPEIIWVSLGAPKQEIFINKLFPDLEKGVLFGIGAAFNFFLDDEINKRAPKLMIRLGLEWIFRIWQEPKRIGRRALNYLLLLPKLILLEIKNSNNDAIN